MNKNEFVKGALFHLGGNFWDDEIGQGAKKPSRMADHVVTDRQVWQRVTDEWAKAGGNVVIVDLGEAMVYPSHPELAVKGSWTVDEMTKEIARLKAMGLVAVPKLNFSTCHDGWLKEYGRMVSTSVYYRVVADLIADVSEVFAESPYFHIGFDEEMAIAQWNCSLMVVRQGDLWWHDFLACVKEVEKHGKRAVCWSDSIWTNRKEFLKRMPKSVLQSNWYYRKNFSEKLRKWNEEFEKKGGWGECVQGVAAFLELEKAGFDQLPTTSNYFEDGAAQPFVDFLRQNISPSHLKGFVTAPWRLTTPENEPKILNCLHELSAAMHKI